MRKRMLERDLYDEEPPKKKNLTQSDSPKQGIQAGEVLTDLTGKQWKLGKAIGQGGFGEIFLVSEDANEDVSKDAKFVAKIESFQNGPLFVEINCYLRMGKINMINDWKEKNKMSDLGVPHYVASGSHVVNNEKYRFLILPRFSSDLEEILVSKSNKFNIKTVLTIATQIMDILEYIHSKGMVHSDIKASNILVEKQKSKLDASANLEDQNTREKNKMLRYYGSTPTRSCRVKKMTCVRRNLRPNGTLRAIQQSESKNSAKVVEVLKSDQIYLLDYGLACKYIRSTGHLVYGRDERKAHAGTILFCSVDAHIGATSRRSDLECLGYNMVYWLTGTLPWIDDVENPELVERKKKRCLVELKIFLNLCFDNCPRFIYDYFKYISKLEFEQTPDYKFLKDLFAKAIIMYGYKHDFVLDFDNNEGWGRKIKKTRCTSENFKVTKIIRQNFKRLPLQSNLPIKPVLRQKITKNKKLNWSKIMVDPELILKQANKERERKLSETQDTAIENLNLVELKPTYHMRNVYNRYMEKIDNANGNSPKSTTDVPSEVEGFTAPMLEILHRIKEKEELEIEEEPVIITKKAVKKRKLKLPPKCVISPRRTRSSKTTVSDARKGRKKQVRG